MMIKFFRFCFLFLNLIMIMPSEAVNQADVQFAISQAHSPLDIVKLFLPSNPSILEAGAHYGEDTINMLSYWPQACIFAFEPNPYAYNLLKQNTANYSNIAIYNLALFNKDGHATFYVQQKWGNDGASSLLPEDSSFAGNYEDVPIIVSCQKLDTWFEDNHFPSIDFMWLDMEGAELYALQAGTNILENVKVIYTEINFYEFRTGMTQYADLVQFLNEHGFEEIYQKRYPQPQGDSIFIKKDILVD